MAGVDMMSNCIGTPHPLSVPWGTPVALIDAEDEAPQLVHSTHTSKMRYNVRILGGTVGIWVFVGVGVGLIAAPTGADGHEAGRQQYDKDCSFEVSHNSLLQLFVVS